MSSWRRAALAASAVTMTMSMTLIGAADPAAARTCMTPGASGNDPAAESLMDLTVKASRSGGYAGTVWVEIHGQGGTRSGALRVVHADAGHLAIEAPDPPGPATGTLLVQAGKSRSVVRVGVGSADRGQTALVDDIEPDSNLQQVLGKYRVLLEGGVRVLQRDASVVRIERIADDRLVERWTIDATSGLLLKRDSYSATGTVERSIAFTEVRQPYVPKVEDLHPTVEDLHPPAQPDPSPAAPQRWFSAGELSRQAKALGMPETLPARYRLESGTTFKAGAASVVQLVYTDGLEDVSLFAQPGSMVRSGLPASARNVGLSKVDGLGWEGFPRGLAWQDGQSTLTLVGAAPTDELTQMANALPQSPLRRSLRQRLGHLVDWMKHRLP